MDFSRQLNIFNPEDFKTPIHIIGAGATGSPITFMLAKLGVKNISIYDFDNVEVHNLPNQMYEIMDVGSKKATSLKRICRKSTGTIIKAYDEKVDGSRPLQGIVFMLTDTMSSRDEIYRRAIKNNPNVQLLIETRMDLRGGRIYAIDPKNRVHTKKYEDTLYTDADAEVSACGTSQTVITTAWGISSHAIWKFLNHVNGDTMYNETVIDFDNEYTLTQEWNNETDTKENNSNEVCGDMPF